MQLSAGDKLGHYEIIALLGKGGMGEVWKARDTRLNRVVAIKRLSGTHIGRFEQEARAIAALNHPHICQIFDIGPDYLVLEYIDGVPLKGPVPLEQALQLASHIAGALEAAHAKGILHRDLKPGNVLVTGNGAKLLDFGLAKSTGDADATQTIGVSGTPVYMSPEQAEGKPLDARSDIFSFGSVLYELITGQRAFKSLASVLSDEPAPVDSSASEVVLKCLKKQVADRYQFMAEVRSALEQIGLKPAQPQPSIAVLPFANLSGDKDQEYFSDGLAEEILNLLAKIPGLKVIARTSSFSFRGKEQDITKIAQTLRVRTILEGSVRKAGSRIRVTAQLIDASDSSHIWSERYDRELKDVFEVQDEIAGAIADALRLKLRPEARKHTPAPAAYEEFLKARHYLQKWSPESAAKAQQCLGRALARDPGFALAHTERCRVFSMMTTENAMRPEEAAPLMRASAQAALDIDPSLPDAHGVLAMAAVLDFDWQHAGEEFRRALSHEPIPANVRIDYSLWYLAPLERMKEAREQMERALIDDPLNLFARVHLGAYLMASGRSSEGEGVENQVVELAPDFFIPYVWLASHRVLQGRLAEARAYAERMVALAPWNPGATGYSRPP